MSKSDPGASKNQRGKTIRWVVTIFFVTILISGIISLNETAAFLLAALSEEQTEESLLAAMLEEFDTDAATARADIADFLASLRTLGLLEGADA